MSAGSFETGPEQADTRARPGPYAPADGYSQPGPYAPADPYLQPDPYAQPGYPQAPGPQAGQFGPVSAQFQRDYAVLPRRTNALAIAALSCGVGQLIAGPVAGIPAIVLGSMSLRQIRDSGEDGHAMAVTGLVLGIVGTALFVIGVALFIAFAVVAWHVANSPGVPG